MKRIILIVLASLFCSYGYSQTVTATDLRVTKTAKFPIASKGNNKLMKSDANGVATWTAVKTINGSSIIGSGDLTISGVDSPYVYATSTCPDGSCFVLWYSDDTKDTVSLSPGRWTARVGSTTSSATPTINTDNYDIYKLTAQSADITSMTTNLSGTPNDGDIIEFQITGTASRAITWGSAFVSTSVTLPTTTSGTNTLFVIAQYSTTSSYGANKWGCVNYY